MLHLIKRARPLVLPVFLGLALAGATAAAQAEASPQRDPLSALRVEIPATQMVLQNGLTLVVHEDHSAPLVAISIWYHVGSKNETAGKTGFAHLFEHLMFNGSENFNDDFFKATQKLGATQQNGTTSVDRTNYFQTVPKASLDAMLWLESDRMGHLLGAIDQAKLDEQRAVVKNEKRQRENSPYSIAADLITRATTPVGHPYDHTPIGSMADLDAASVDDVKTWFRTYYGPSNAVIVLVGDITPDEAKAKVEKYFGDIPPGTPVSQPTSWEIRKTGTVREIAYDRVAQARLYRVWNVSDYASPDTDYLQILAEVLAGDRNSRLYKRLVLDDQIATSVSAGVDNREIGGQFQIVADVKPGADIGVAENVIEEELQKLVAQGPTQGELSRVRTSIIGGVARRLESISAKANILAESTTFLGDPHAWQAGFERLREAQPADIQRVGRTWLGDGDYVLSILPFGNLAAATQGVDRSAVPKPGADVAATFPAVERATLANGLKLVVARRTGVPVVNMTMLFKSGTPADWQSQPVGAGSLAMAMLDEGTKTRTGEQIVDQLSALGAKLGAGGGGETSSVTLSALKPALKPSMAIFADVILNPAFATSDLNRLKAQSLAGLAQVRQDPGSIASRVRAAIMFGPESAYGQLSSEASIGNIDRSALITFHDRWFRPNSATLVVTGDTTLAKIRPLVEAAFAGWKSGAVPQTIEPQAAPHPVAAVYLIDKPGAEQSVVQAVFAAPRRLEGDEIARETWNEAFGGSFTSRINMMLREEKGWAYGARSSIGGGRGARLFTAGASVQTDKTAASMHEIAVLIEDVANGRPIDAGELAVAKGNLSLGLSSAWSTSGGIASYLSDQITSGLPDDYYVNYPAAIDAATLDAVNAAGADIVKDHPITWIVVGDRAKIEASIRTLNLGEVHVVDADGEPVP